MSSNVKVKIDSEGIRKNILQADFMLKYVEQVAGQMTDGDSHVKSFIGFDRAQAIVYPNTKDNPG